MKNQTHLQLLFAMVVAMISFNGFSQLFPNGDFELGPAPSNCQCPTNITCGNDAGRVIDGFHPVYVPGNQGCVGAQNYAPALGAFSGTSSVYFYAGADNINAQAVNFVGGEEVCLEIYYCGPQGAGASGQNTANSHFSFKLDGAQIGPDVAVPVNTGWTLHSMSVIMTAGAHTFGILSGGAAQYAIWFDDFDAQLCSTPGCDPTWTATVACSTDPPINLDALITGDTGGTWSGTGVTGNMFDPSLGTQSITYTNAAPCVDFSTQTITVTTTATATWTLPGALCSNDAPINLDLLITGTAGGTWSGTGVTGNMFDPASGTQNVTYTVGTAPCDANSTQSITVTPAGDASWTSPGAICEVSGIVDLSALITGDVGGTWSGTGVTGTNFDPTGLSGAIAITYTVGTAPCADQITQNITVVTSPTATWTVPTNLCDSDAPLDLTTTITGTAGGTWSGTGMTGSTFDPSVGSQNITYTVGVAPCGVSSVQMINVIPAGDASWTTAGTICESDGIIDLSALITGDAGGTWSGTGVSGTNFDPTGLSGLIAVTYDVGTAPCADQLTLNIDVVSNPDPNWTIPTNLCTTDPPFDLSINVTGTVGGTWTGSGMTGSNFDPSGGTQSITYTVGSGACLQDLTQIITVGNGGNPTWTTLFMCISDAPIDLTAQITGDFGGTWSGTGMTGSTFDPASGTQPITYSAGSAGCLVDLTQDITVYDPTVTINSNNISCFGATDGDATAVVSGGSGNYSYSWSTTETTTSISGLAAGNYIVTITDLDAGCTATASIDITEPLEITGTLTAASGCSPQLGSATVTPTGGAGGFTYLWNSSAETTQTAVALDSAMQIVVVTDANGCTYTDSIEVNVYPSPTVTIINDTTIVRGACLRLDAWGASTYSWYPDYELTCDDCQDPIACPEIETIYCVTAADTNGCIDSTCVKISIEIVCGDVFVPSAFSPNNDGENDLECFYSDCIESMVFTIYNRWGEQVFETSDMNICWDGTWKGKELSSAVFVYRLEGILINNERISQKGNISLIR